MIEEIRLAWTDRLRDHTNPQGVKRLMQRIDQQFIFDVWGHLCYLACDDSIVYMDYTRCGFITLGDGKLHVRYPPVSVLEWAGIDREAGPSSDIVLHLAARNDNESNFPFMAEEIDQYLG